MLARVCLIVLASLTLSVVDAWAGGFYIRIRGASSVGLSSAGDAARASDPSTVFFNPAGMTQIRAPTLEAGVDAITPNISIDPINSKAVTPGSLGIAAPFSGVQGKSDNTVVIPNLYYVQPINQDFVLGFAVATPFGLKVEYAKDWAGRYDSIKTHLVTMDLSPSFAWRLSPQLSIGGGINLQHADAELSNAVPNVINPGGPTAGTDGLARVTGSGWAVGFNVGTLFQPTEYTRVGIHYRSGMKHRLNGQLSVNGLAGPLAGGNGVVDTKTEFRIPAVLSLAVTQKVTSEWNLLAQWQWFEWSKFDNVSINYSSGLPATIRPQNFRNSASAAIGAEYKVSDKWLLNTGFRIDKTPTVDGFRNSSIPDSNVRWFGVGTRYRITDHLQFDIALSQARAAQSGIDLAIPFFAGTPVSSVVNFQGLINSRLNTLSVSLRYAM